VFPPDRTRFCTYVLLYRRIPTDADGITQSGTRKMYKDENRSRRLLFVLGVSVVLTMLFGRRLFWKTRDRMFPRLPILKSLPPLSDVGSRGLFLCGIVIQIGFIVGIRDLDEINALLFCLWTIAIVLFDEHILCPQLVYFNVAILSTVFRDEAWFLKFYCVCLYFWGGAQKLNHNFCTDGWMTFFKPFFSRVFSGSWKGPRLPDSVVATVGASIALTESVLGIMLLRKDTEMLAASLLCAMHITILVTVIATNEYQPIWPWNMACCFVLINAFVYGLGGNVSAGGTWEDLRAVWNEGGNASLRLFLYVMLFGLAPVLSWFDMWHPNMSFQMHSSNFTYAEMKILRTRAKGGREDDFFPLYSHAQDYGTSPALSCSAFKRWALCISASENCPVVLVYYGRPNPISGRRDCTRWVAEDGKLKRLAWRS